MTVTRWGDSKLHVTSSNSNIIKASIQGTVIILTRVAGGNATITVSADEGTNYLKPANVTIMTNAAAITESIPQIYSISANFKQKGTLTYNGTSQSVTIDNFNPQYHVLNGTTSAVDAGSYTAKISPKEGYHWHGTNGDTSEISVTWKIDKANPTLTLSKTSINLTVDKTSDTSIITYIGEGTATVIVNATSNNNYKSASNVNISVTCGADIYYIDKLPTAAETSFEYKENDTRTLNVVNGVNEGFTQTGKVSLQGLAPGEYQAVYQLKPHYEWRNAPTTDIKISVPYLPITKFMKNAPPNIPVPINDLDTNHVTFDDDIHIPKSVGRYSITFYLTQGNSIWLNGANTTSRTLYYNVVDNPDE